MTQAFLGISSIEQAIEVYTLANGLQNINFVSEDVLDTDILNAFDCVPASNKSYCSNKTFSANARCSTSGCEISVHLDNEADPGSDWIDFISRRDSNGQWNHYCVWFDYEGAEQECQSFSPKNYTLIFDGDFDW